MLKRPVLVGVGLLVCVGLLLGPSYADDPDDTPKSIDPAEAPKEVTEHLKSFDTVGLATALADYGLQHRSPMALIEAARILKEAKAGPLNEPVGGDSDKAAPSTGKKAEPSKYAPNTLLEKAIEIAETDKKKYDLALKYADEVSSTKGVMGGPKFYRINHLNPGFYQDFVLTFNARENAVVEVAAESAGGRVRVQPFLRAGNRWNLLNEKRGTRLVFQWHPSVQQRYVFRVFNITNLPIGYRLATN
jgi:hypothetical protein